MWSQARYWRPGIGECWHPHLPLASEEALCLWYIGSKEPWPSWLFDVCNKMWFLTPTSVWYCITLLVFIWHYQIPTVKENTGTLLCFSQCWSSTMPRLWGIVQIFLYNPPGTLASCSLILDRAVFLQAFWLVILHGFFVVTQIFPYLCCLLMSWFEATSCLFILLFSCFALIYLIAEEETGLCLKQKQNHNSSTKTCPSFEKCKCVGL